MLLHPLSNLYMKDQPAWERMYCVLAQLLATAGAPAVVAARKASAQVSATYQAQRLHEQLQLLRQPQLRRRA